MFDHRSINKVNINTPATGIIQKSYINSYFRTLHQRSPLADELFSNDSDEVVLQVLLTDDKWLMVELIDKKSFEDDNE